MDQRDQTGDVRGIENDDAEFQLRRVLADVAAELRGDLGVALEQILASHAFLARRAAGADHEARAAKRFTRVGGPCHVGSGEGAVIDLLGRAFVALVVRIVHRDVRRQAHRQRGLHHVRTDRARRTENDEFILG